MSPKQHTGNTVITNQYPVPIKRHLTPDHHYDSAMKHKPVCVDPAGRRHPYRLLMTPGAGRLPDPPRGQKVY